MERSPTGKTGFMIMLDFTIGTTSNVIGFKRYENVSAPFNIKQYEAFDNTYNGSRVMPMCWGEEGTIVDVDWDGGCSASEFDQYGDMEAFGVHPGIKAPKEEGLRLQQWNPPLINLADGDQTSGGEEVAAPTIPPKRRRRRSRHSSRASTVVDDRKEWEPASTAPTTLNAPSTLLPQPPPFYNSPEPPRLPSSPWVTNGDAGRVSPLVKANGNAAYTYEKPILHRGVVVEDEDDVPQHPSPWRPLPHPPTPDRGFTQLPNVRLPLAVDTATSSSPTESTTSATTVPVYLYYPLETRFLLARSPCL
ncbi:glycoside hydrolase family 13 protein [Laetiporus sulphureus 93-53]|uniref:Glycoside hydrolase family 13 protein n=1 Tax=Laetiporus sulphureus 93-53 TaxID=1314785 RepID=A0A165B3E6_9APHY|nr:glycoside hydrolase family 13 protein [Laetiporus sulphureus 93-53]KZT00148.1 glycoside hydrolase family 13 protein [Laetiporus sulphureus 93-53]